MLMPQTRNASKLPEGFFKKYEKIFNKRANKTYHVTCLSKIGLDDPFAHEKVQGHRHGEAISPDVFVKVYHLQIVV